MKRKTLVIVLNLFYLTISCLYAQLSLEERFEMQGERNRSDDFEIVSLKEEGLILIRVAKPWKYADPKDYDLIFFDKNLKEIKKQTLNLPYEYANERFTYFDKNKYLYFFYQDQANYMIHIMRYDIYNDEYKDYEFKPPVKLKIDDFRAMEDLAFFTGTLNSKRVVVSFEFISENVNVLPSFYNRNEFLSTIQPDPVHKEIYFGVFGRNNGDCNFIIKSYSNLIGTITDYAVNNRNDQAAKEGLLYAQSPGYRSIIGLYSENCSKNNQGLFIADFDGNQQQNIRYKPFVDLSNFFNYYSEQKANRLREKVEKKRSKGKKVNMFRKFVMADEFYETKDEAILLIEGYYSAYSNDVNMRAGNLNTFYNYNARRYIDPSLNGLYRTNFYNTRTATNQFNYGILCAFDKEGRLLWDNVIDIESVEKSELTNVVKIGHLEDSITLAYEFNDKFYSKMIHRYKTVREEKEQEMKDIFPEEVNSTYWGDFIHWYDNNYLYFGEQGKKGNPFRTFHLSKLSYYPQAEEPEAQKSKKNKDKDDKQSIK